MKLAKSIALIGLAVIGCASYSARELPLPDRKGFSSATERSGIWVGAKAYSDIDRQQSYLV